VEEEEGEGEEVGEAGGGVEEVDFAGVGVGEGGGLL
jgi:hypothetical protein